MATNWARLKSDWLDEFNYVRNCVPKKYFIELLPKRLNQLVRQYGDRWCVVICGIETQEEDYFVVPFAIFKPFVDERYLVPKGKGQPRPCRWLFQVRDKILSLFPPTTVRDELSATKVDITSFYGNPEALFRLVTASTKVS